MKSKTANVIRWVYAISALGVLITVGLVAASQKELAYYSFGISLFIFLAMNILQFTIFKNVDMKFKDEK